jgi:hypothetical protein
MFFKQIKQTLKLGAFLGQSRNAIEWQVWTALLTYILLRFLHASAHLSAGRALAEPNPARLRAILWDSRRLISNTMGPASGVFTKI